MTIQNNCIQNNHQSIIKGHNLKMTDLLKYFRNYSIWNKKYKYHYVNNNQPVQPQDIPKDVTHLIFGDQFNQLLQIDDIPNSVTHLTLGDSFNKPLLP